MKSFAASRSQARRGQRIATSLHRSTPSPAGRTHSGKWPSAGILAESGFDLGFLLGQRLDGSSHAAPSTQAGFGCNSRKEK